MWVKLWQRLKGSGVYESIVETHELCEETPQTNDATSNVPEEGKRIRDNC